MRVLILEVNSNELVRGLIREGEKSDMPSIMDGWLFDFSKNIQPKGKKAFVLVKEDTPKVIEGCMIFSLHETFGPYMDYLEVAPHNKGDGGKYKRISGCLIAYACGLSFEKGADDDRGILTFKAFSEDDESTKKLEKFYRENFGAIMSPFRFMEIHQNQSGKLIEEYMADKVE
jgi:hypothetical protein